MPESDREELRTELDRLDSMCADRRGTFQWAGVARIGRAVVALGRLLLEHLTQVDPPYTGPRCGQCAHFPPRPILVERDGKTVPLLGREERPLHQCMAGRGQVTAALKADWCSDFRE